MIKQIEMGMTTCLTGAETRLGMVFDVLGGENSIRRWVPGGSLLIAKKPHYLH
jgi:hypothetical protein